MEIDKSESGILVNLVPRFREEEFFELDEEPGVPINFLRDSLDIDKRPRYKLENGIKFTVIKTPAENNSFFQRQQRTLHHHSHLYYFNVQLNCTGEFFRQWRHQKIS